MLLYELLSGARPYRNTTGALELAQAILTETPRLIGAHAGRRVDRDLENIVQMALRKEPERRYPSADLLSEDLRRYAAGYPVMARPASRGYRIARFAGRNKAPVAALAVVLLALIGGIAATAWEARIANERFNDVRQLAHAVVFDYHDAIEALPGSTPVRKRLVKDALVYLDKLSRQSGDTSLQREMVEAYVKIGNVQGNSYNSNLGDMAGALASLRKAVAAGERLVARDAGGLNQRALASAYSAEADVLYSQNDLAAADLEYRKAASLAEAAVRKLPPDPETRRQWAGTLRNWGDLAGAEGMSNMGKPEVALARYRQSLEIVRGLVKEYPGSRPARKDLYDSLLYWRTPRQASGITPRRRNNRARRLQSKDLGVLNARVLPSFGDTSTPAESGRVPASGVKLPTARRAVLVHRPGRGLREREAARVVCCVA